MNEHLYGQQVIRCKRCGTNRVFKKDGFNELTKLLSALIVFSILFLIFLPKFIAYIFFILGLIGIISILSQIMMKCIVCKHEFSVDKEDYKEYQRAIR